MPDPPPALEPFGSDVRRVEKPWGHEIIFALTDRYCGKVIFVRAGEQLSLQFHERKDETIYLQNGRIELEIGSAVEIVLPGASFRLVPGVVHRWRAL